MNLQTLEKSAVDGGSLSGKRERSDIESASALHPIKKLCRKESLSSATSPSLDDTLNGNITKSDDISNERPFEPYRQEKATASKTIEPEKAENAVVECTQPAGCQRTHSNEPVSTCQKRVLGCWEDEPGEHINLNHVMCLCPKVPKLCRTVSHTPSPTPGGECITPTADKASRHAGLSSHDVLSYCSVHNLSKEGDHPVNLCSPHLNDYNSQTRLDCCHSITEEDGSNSNKHTIVAPCSSVVHTQTHKRISPTQCLDSNKLNFKMRDGIVSEKSTESDAVAFCSFRFCRKNRIELVMQKLSSSEHGYVTKDFSTTSVDSAISEPAMHSEDMFSCIITSQSDDKTHSETIDVGENQSREHEYMKQQTAPNDTYRFTPFCNSQSFPFERPNLYPASESQPIGEGREVPFEDLQVASCEEEDRVSTSRRPSFHNVSLSERDKTSSTVTLLSTPTSNTIPFPSLCNEITQNDTQPFSKSKTDDTSLEKGFLQQREPCSSAIPLKAEEESTENNLQDTCVTDGKIYVSKGLQNTSRCTYIHSKYGPSDSISSLAATTRNVLNHTISERKYDLNKSRECRSLEQTAAAKERLQLLSGTENRLQQTEMYEKDGIENGTEETVFAEVQQNAKHETSCFTVGTQTYNIALEAFANTSNVLNNQCHNTKYHSLVQSHNSKKRHSIFQDIKREPDSELTSPNLTSCLEPNRFVCSLLSTDFINNSDNQLLRVDNSNAGCEQDYLHYQDTRGKDQQTHHQRLQTARPLIHRSTQISHFPECFCEISNLKKQDVLVQRNADRKDNELVHTETPSYFEPKQVLQLADPGTVPNTANSQSLKFCGSNHQGRAESSDMDSVSGSGYCSTRSGSKTSLSLLSSIEEGRQAGLKGSLSVSESADMCCCIYTVSNLTTSKVCGDIFSERVKTPSFLNDSTTDRYLLHTEDTRSVCDINSTVDTNKEFGHFIENKNAKDFTNNESIKDVNRKFESFDTKVENNFKHLQHQNNDKTNSNLIESARSSRHIGIQLHNCSNNTIRSTLSATSPEEDIKRDHTIPNSDENDKTTDGSNEPKLTRTFQKVKEMNDSSPASARKESIFSLHNPCVSTVTTPLALGNSFINFSLINKNSIQDTGLRVRSPQSFNNDAPVSSFSGKPSLGSREKSSFSCAFSGVEKNNQAKPTEKTLKPNSRVKSVISNLGLENNPPLVTGDSPRLLPQKDMYSELGNTQEQWCMKQRPYECDKVKPLEPSHQETRCDIGQERQLSQFDEQDLGRRNLLECGNRCQNTRLEMPGHFDSQHKRESSQSQCQNDHICRICDRLHNCSNNTLRSTLSATSPEGDIKRDHMIPNSDENGKTTDGSNEPKLTGTFQKVKEMNDSSSASARKESIFSLHNPCVSTVTTPLAFGNSFINFSLVNKNSIQDTGLRVRSPQSFNNDAPVSSFSGKPSRGSGEKSSFSCAFSGVEKNNQAKPTEKTLKPNPSVKSVISNVGLENNPPLVTGDSPRLLPQKDMYSELGNTQEQWCIKQRPYGCDKVKPFEPSHQETRCDLGQERQLSQFDEQDLGRRNLLECGNRCQNTRLEMPGHFDSQHKRESSQSQCQNDHICRICDRLHNCSNNTLRSTLSATSPEQDIKRDHTIPNSDENGKTTDVCEQNNPRTQREHRLECWNRLQENEKRHRIDYCDSGRCQTRSQRKCRESHSGLNLSAAKKRTYRRARKLLRQICYLKSKEEMLHRAAIRFQRVRLELQEQHSMLFVRCRTRSRHRHHMRCQSSMSNNGAGWTSGSRPMLGVVKVDREPGVQPAHPPKATVAAGDARHQDVGTVCSADQQPGISQPVTTRGLSSGRPGSPGVGGQGRRRVQLAPMAASTSQTPSSLSLQPANLSARHQHDEDDHDPDDDTAQGSGTQRHGDDDADSRSSRSKSDGDDDNDDDEDDDDDDDCDDWEYSDSSKASSKKVKTTKARGGDEDEDSEGTDNDSNDPRFCGFFRKP